MSEEKSILKEAFDSIDDIIKNSGSDDYKMMVLGVEFNKDGMPTARGMRCSGSPAMVLAAITLLIRMLEEQEQETLDKIDQLGDISGKLDELMSKLGISDLDDPRFLGMIEKSTDGERLKKLIQELKRKFGK
jgi:hypothetical protein